MADVTPMLKQYMELKEAHKGAILFFRLGDFYEMFGEDAELASRELEITLTSRDVGRGGRIPMCGVPYHAAESYIGRLISKGYKVAICEQLEDPRAARGLVKRDVIRVVTPGTVMEPELLTEKENNYLVAIEAATSAIGFAACDVSTGEFLLTEIGGDEAQDKLLGELSRLSPKECILGPNARGNSEIATLVASLPGLMVSEAPEGAFDEAMAQKRLLTHFGVPSLEALGCEDMRAGVSACGAIISYLGDVGKTGLAHIKELRVYSLSEHMIVDRIARRNLELTESIRDGSRKMSLLGVLDRTVTAMGARLLVKWLLGPLLSVAEIERRLDIVEALVTDGFLREGLRGLLREVYDLERLSARVAQGTANARDLKALGDSITRIPEIRALFADVKSDALRALAAGLSDISDVAELISKAIAENPPVALTEGGIIREGYNEELDKLREARGKGKGWLAELELRERERTGIKSLKVGYNQVFGYYIEVTRANLNSVPADYVRRQTLANSERFVTEELTRYEEMILGAEEKILKLEYEIFSAVREQVSLEVDRIRAAAALLAQLDVFASLAEAAVANGYTRPEVDEGDAIVIEEGRHPIVEHFQSDTPFVPNDCHLDTRRNQILLITGPNMAGKSTYIRQVALIVVMAQIGSFVPARAARIGLVDRIFTRIGATDDLAMGQSTFMREMLEARRHALATKKSLVLVDELGRGTSTYDGIAIAQAYLEMMAREVGCKVLFSTHYHELTSLEKEMHGVRNYHMETAIKGGKPVFLYRVAPGPATRSYGINVARLAGFDSVFCKRAEEILRELERGNPQRLQLSLFGWEEVSSAAGSAGSAGPVDGSTTSAATSGGSAVDPDASTPGVGLGESSAAREVIDELRNLEPDSMTPLEALMKLAVLHERLCARNK